MAVANYADANGHFPPAFIPGPDGRPWHSWRVLVLPYIEGQSLFKRYNFSEPWDGPNNRLLADEMPRLYGFPGTRDRADRIANYLAVVGAETMWPGATPFRGQPKDGSSNTILFVENDGLDVPWMEPRDLVFSEMDFGVQRPGGVSSRYKTPGVVMVEGSVRTLSPGLDPNALRAMLTAAGGEKLTDTAGGWQVIEDGRDRELR